jgi:DUF4097 and DUF4098 domain-containing protein YvlB
MPTTTSTRRSDHAASTHCAAHAADRGITSFSKQVPVGERDRVHISNVSGSVTVTTWDRREVDVQGELESGVERVLVENDAGGVEIRVIIRDKEWKRSSARLTIRLPADVMLEASTVSAPLSVRGVRGRLRLKSVSGSIVSDVLGTDAEARTVSGRIELTGNKTRGRVRAASVSGNVVLVGIAGDAEAKTTSGDVEVSMETADNLRAQSVSGDVIVRGALARDGDQEVQVHSGRAKVNTLAADGYRYEITSYSGRLTSCFDLQPEENRRSKRFVGVRGAGRGSLRVKSFSGSVDVCDR